MQKKYIGGFCLSVLAAFGLVGSALADGKDISVKGELVDTFCFLTMSAKGAGHKQCAVECAKKGIPVGIVQEGTGKLYVLLPAKNGESLPDSVTSKMGETVTVNGDEYVNGGSQFIRVESVS